MRSSLFAQYRAWLVLAILPWLASCGGGGGGGAGEACASCSIGGTVSGLTGTVVLQLNGAGGTSVSANGGFTFPMPQPNGTTYAVTVLTQPANQHCSVGSGTGILGGANVANVAVSCGPSAFSVGGAIAGLAGTVVLQNNGGDDLSRSGDGAFTFLTPVSKGGGYAVTVLTQPAGQTCSVANGVGTAGANVTSVAVTCSASSFSVGGTVSGLAGTLVLRNNGANLTLNADGPFSFAGVAQGGAYGVTVLNKPDKQSCSVTNGSGTVAGANVSNVAVACVNLNVVFVTSTSSDANLGGLAGANAKCNALAGAAGLPGNYMAFLSDIHNPPAVVRLGAARGWVRPDGFPFADEAADLHKAKIFYPPWIDETGAAAPAGTPVFTNTDTFQGRPATTSASCADWSMPISTGEFVLTGIPNGGNGTWMFANAVGCNGQARLYCFGTDSSAPLNPTPATGRFAFQSSAAFTPASGRATADAVCQSEASGAGLPGTYKALLAAIGSSAASRFSTAGSTWVRRDGVRVFASAVDLATTTMMAPVDVTADGTYVGVRGQVAWIGASSFSAIGTPTTTCGDWSDTTSLGSVAQADRAAPLVLSFPCKSVLGLAPAHLICLQE